MCMYMLINDHFILFICWFLHIDIAVYVYIYQRNILALFETYKND